MRRKDLRQLQAPNCGSWVRARKPAKRRPRLDTWFYPLELGKPLPAIPLWLAENLVVRLDLEPTYEDTCRVLHIV